MEHPIPVALAQNGKTKPQPSTVTIEVSGGVVQNVYASKNLPPISVELIDFDNLCDAPDAEFMSAKRLLEDTDKEHNHIF